MSRIGRKPIAVPANVKVEIANGAVTVEGPKGKLSLNILPNVEVKFEEGELKVNITAEDRQTRAFFGLTRALLQNNVIGVTQGYESRLQVVGTGYISAVQGNLLELRVGFANEIKVEIPSDLKVSCPNQQHIVIQGIDKQKVTNFAASVRAIRKPEPYLGKGIRYENEHVRRKERKNVGK